MPASLGIGFRTVATLYTTLGLWISSPESHSQGQQGTVQALLEWQPPRAGTFVCSIHGGTLTPRAVPGTS